MGDDKKTYLSIAGRVERILKGKEEAVKKGWKFAKGVVLFPELECPFCRETIRSKAIWKIDERHHLLIGQGVPDKRGKLLWEGARHPHARMDGRGTAGICMGGNRTVKEALFGRGINLWSIRDGSPARIRAWLETSLWDHKCSSLKDGSKVKCGGCGEWIRLNEMYPGGPRRSSKEDFYWCHSCYNKHNGICPGCNNIKDKSTLDGEGYCPTCSGRERCKKCKTRVPPSVRKECGFGVGCCCRCVRCEARKTGSLITCGKIIKFDDRSTGCGKHRVCVEHLGVCQCEKIVGQCTSCSKVRPMVELCDTCYRCYEHEESIHCTRCTVRRRGGRGWDYL